MGMRDNDWDTRNEGMDNERMGWNSTNGKNGTSPNTNGAFSSHSIEFGQINRANQTSDGVVGMELNGIALQIEWDSKQESLILA